MTTVGEAVGSYVAWPRHLILPDKKSQDGDSEVNHIESAIKAFRELIDKSFEIHEHIEIPIDKEVFGISIPFIIPIEDILHICDMEQLGVTCLMVYMSYLQKLNSNSSYGFINPISVSTSKSSIVVRALTDRFGNASDVDFYCLQPGPTLDLVNREPQRTHSLLFGSIGEFNS
ncbi:hypothetical protein QJS10_CPA02g00586 [Acorus calamus]|uniref:Uncharacterized protein n=1 Tax=Acorus calamus TaxID=4465 RepID=A0AAV9FDS9_ACOCL|nr:hypothetical protein QJS10_CPA02g00586 [Acorus calamus]